MKFANYIYASLIALLAVGCNEGIFIDDIRPDISEVTLDGNGDRYVVSLPYGHKFDNISIYTSSSVNLQCTLYDAYGNKVGWSSSGNGYRFHGLGRMEFHNDMLAFSLERTSSDALILNVDENAFPHEFECQVCLHSEHVGHYIDVSITPCDRYVLDDFSIAATLMDVSWTETEELLESVGFDHRGSGAASMTLYPYREAQAEVQFEFFYCPIYTLFPEPVEVEIPRDFGFDPQFVGDKVKISPDLQILPSMVDPAMAVEAQATPQAYNEFKVFVKYRKMSMWYRARMHNPSTGRERTAQDIVWIKEPVDYEVRHSIHATYE